MASSPYTSRGMSTLLLFVLIFSSTRIEVDAAVVNHVFPICKIIVDTSNRYFDINFCMEALNSDNRSRYTNDYAGFTIIAVDLLTANATSTATQIVDLLKKEANVDGPVRWCLRSCQQLYGSILKMQPRCSDLVKEFRDDEAKSCLDQAAREIEQCEAEFVKRSVASPLAIEDDSAFKLAMLASALLQHAHA